MLLPYFLSDLEYVERLFWPNENFEKSNQAWKISWKKKRFNRKILNIKNLILTALEIFDDLKNKPFRKFSIKS